MMLQSSFHMSCSFMFRMVRAAGAEQDIRTSQEHRSSAWPLSSAVRDVLSVMYWLTDGHSQAQADQ